MEWKRMDAYQTLVARLQEKYRARDGAVSALVWAAVFAAAVRRLEIEDVCIERWTEK